VVKTMNFRWVFFTVTPAG